MIDRERFDFRAPKEEQFLLSRQSIKMVARTRCPSKGNLSQSRIRHYDLIRVLVLPIEWAPSHLSANWKKKLSKDIRDTGRPWCVINFWPNYISALFSTEKTGIVGMRFSEVIDHPHEKSYVSSGW